MDPLEDHQTLKRFDKPKKVVFRFDVDEHFDKVHDVLKLQTFEGVYWHSVVPPNHYEVTMLFFTQQALDGWVDIFDQTECRFDIMEERKVVVVVEDTKPKPTKIEIAGDGEPCVACGDPCNSVAGDPNLWPSFLLDESGKTLYYHCGCLTKIKQNAEKEES